MESVGSRHHLIYFWGYVRVTRSGVNDIRKIFNRAAGTAQWSEDPNVVVQSSYIRKLILNNMIELETIHLTPCRSEK